ncbi:M48 family peptidase [Paramagnetospirillum kuznetsovii]|uniref:M48 family peptidase n=1 Tax=Paramagnetospirillum kuznetsovii TaxID=2053833 RepID=A0A364P0M8_9PROT|nr:SprT family zinc-dependent metalloprotease [Paramagnetospirillum kuznetsovii]RAU22856.1 M48 family peptidase [Paramagnetospirillum kuznetsovii]
MNKPLLLHMDGHDLSLAVRRSGTAGRMSLRLAPGGGVVVVLPLGVPEAEAERFAKSQRDWILARLRAMPGRVALIAGATVPLLGMPHVIQHQPAARRGVWAEDGVINVSGREEHVPRRVAEFLREEARLLVAHRARDLAVRIGRKVGRVGVRDTRSRWGSCSSDGSLSFSWRLVMAPDWVLDYVVAHEVAHLVEMNHGPEFWRLVETMVADIKAPKAWLKRHGPELHCYGTSP